MIGRSTLALLAAALILAGCGDPPPSRPKTKAERAAAVPFAGREAKQVLSAFPDALRDVLEQAERATLYSLNPDRLQDGELSPEKERFHNYGVLSQREVTDEAVQRKLVEAVYRGLKGEDASPADSFSPRHGLRFELGSQSIDLLICFQCTWVHVFVDDSEKKLRMLFGAGVKPVFDSAIKAP